MQACKSSCMHMKNLQIEADFPSVLQLRFNFFP